uniref:DNA-directed RNA polymerase n=1 Tax=Asparagopsis taxiformis TaxID=260499 RepID=A0A1C9CC17_9FLOR|nr:RNA polymerase beta'' subunit [Asparagopsis taxiformis]AOM65917.1 RNA polymerase beta'' subunit [Asparagopsis taxiformis]
MKRKIKELQFSNQVIDKSQLKQLIIWSFRNYGIARAANMVDKLKDLGFYYATKAGISLSLEDLRIPPSKKKLLNATIDSISETDQRFKRGEITAVERFQKVIDTWNNASETLKQDVIKYFKNTDPLNSIYMMAFSGARGNISQVRQLVGMRGLMADPQGQIIDLPISSNFREGLTITDYFISSYGARKGLVDTALRTADSGYLTRRLVDVAQDVIIREHNCKTSKGILVEEMIDNQKVLVTLKQALLGRVLAEDVIDPVSHAVLAYADQCIDPSLADSIVQSGLVRILVRSPITCDATRSVCQLCYGWNLAHGKIVDLGEAVGIIAAQSIGEPGTQLTMRTFHTGGVFTGELAQTITSAFDARIEYSDDMEITYTRTRHGDNACLINSDCKLKQIDLNGVETFIPLTKGTILLVQNHASVKKDDIIAECPLSTRNVTERAQKPVMTDFSGSIHFADLMIEEIQSKQNIFRSVHSEGIMWVLSGKVYNIPDNAQLMVVEKEEISKNSLLAHTQLISKYNGYVYISPNQDKNLSQEIQVITASKTFSAMNILMNHNNDPNNHILEINNKDKFLLKISDKQKLFNGQIIAELISNVYKTKTGGIIKYLDLDVSKKKINLSKTYYDILGPGYILWISEETHEINKDISLLLIKHGDFVEAGTEIIKNVFAKNSGILEVFQKDGIVREIIIKPGKVYQINSHEMKKHEGKYRGFLRPGEKIADGIVTDKLVYWEYIQTSLDSFILIRPVIVYSIPSKILDCRYTEDSFAIDVIDLQLVRRINYRDGERVKSVTGINLLNTYLVLNLQEHAFSQNCTVHFETISNDSVYTKVLKLITYDILAIRDSSMRNDHNISVNTRILVKNNQYITEKSVIAQTEIRSLTEGKIECIQNKELSNRRVLIVNNTDLRIFKVVAGQVVKVKVHDWVYVGDEIMTNTNTLDSGQIISIKNNQVIMRIGRPYLISNGSTLHVYHNSLVQRGENIATLVFERAKTGDIVQGLPRIEEILEARRKSDNSFNPHIILESKFRHYLDKGLSLYDATRLSLLDTQLMLVKEVQLVYQSQGVDIGDKHIEVIVRQMTSKVKIENGGDTEYLPGEMIELQKIESINKSLALLNQNEALYHPILLGITKASLNTESFISAASFQETTKVLTEAAISGKLDWLRGLKENVIIGRLIPAGTGFNAYNNPVLKNIDSVVSPVNDIDNITNNDKAKIKFDDIILDDRSARNYPMNLNI